jgi:hypothetical protein
MFFMQYAMPHLRRSKCKKYMLTCNLNKQIDNFRNQICKQVRAKATNSAHKILIHRKQSMKHQNHHAASSSTTRSLIALGCAAIFASAQASAHPAPAGSYPSSCGSSSIWTYALLPNGAATKITAFSGDSFTVNNVPPGSYIVRDNSAMLGTNNTVVVGSDKVLKASIVCKGYSYNIEHAAPPILACAAVNVGQMCGEWFKFSPNYYSGSNDVGFAVATPASYPLVPKCAGVSGLAPATTVNGPSSGCFRRFWVKRVAAPQPPPQWVPILKLATWVTNPTPLNLTVGDQIAN